MASTQCAVSKGDLPLKISWFFNNKPAKGLPGISVGQTNQRISTLSIESSNETHAGEYLCIAENSAGKNSFSAVLNVNGILF